jgi:hypothetical protein
LALSAAHLDGPTLPLAFGFDTQIKRDELRQLKGSFIRGKLAHAKLALGELGTYQGEAILVHSGLVLAVARNVVTKISLRFSYDST